MCSNFFLINDTFGDVPFPVKVVKCCTNTFFVNKANALKSKKKSMQMNILDDLAAKINRVHIYNLVYLFLQQIHCV